MSCSNHFDWIALEIERILKHGNTAEVKKEHGEYVVVEIKRKVIKKPNTD